MKSLINKPRFDFLFCGMFLIPALCVAQSDSIWFQSGCKWVHDFVSFSGPGKTYLNYDGMDVKGGIECTRLKYYGYTQPNYQLPPFIETWPDQFVCSRNDSVFIWRDEEWALVYDFTLTEGDTMLLSYSVEFSVVVIEETGLDTILNIPTRYQRWRKLHVLDTTFDYRITVFERLGGEFFLEDAFDLGSSLHEAYYWLSCFRDAVFPELECADLVDLDYTPFPFIPAKWSEHWHSWCTTFGYNYFQSGDEPFDTLIWGVGVGKKLYYQPTYRVEEACPDPSSENLHIAPKLIGLLDQHYLSKQVYFTRLSNDDQDFPLCLTYVLNEIFPVSESVLLYDFDIAQHDVLPWKTGPNEVIYIDTVQMENGEWRRRFHFDLKGEDVWIEGMGSTKGLFSPYYDYDITDVSCYFQCFAESSLLYATVDAWMCDSVISAVTSASIGSEFINVYPNPTNSSLAFNFAHWTADDDIVCVVYDLHGQEVCRQKLDASRQLDILNLSPALYFLTLTNSSSQKLAVGRFIKQ
ncbi:MAG TPA: T9SS type A sorting domain-containing protein [Saprospiraceae bacterium]|nr:T9SS type A sorting domain-containing protein [Saprospiraceae bacterium]